MVCSRGFWPLAGWRSFGALVLGLLPLVPGIKIECQHVLENKTCYFNESRTETSILIDASDLDVSISGPEVTLTATEGCFEIRSKGTVGVDSGAAVKSEHGDVHIVAGLRFEVRDGGSVTAEERWGGSVIAGSKMQIGKLAIEVGGSSRAAAAASAGDLLQAQVVVDQAALRGDMNLSIKATGKVQIRGDEARLESKFGNIDIVSSTSSVEVYDNAHIVAGMGAGAEKTSGNVTVQGGCGTSSAEATGLGLEPDGDFELEDVLTGVAITNGASILAKSYVTVAGAKVIVGSEVQLNSTKGSVSLGSTDGCKCTDRLYAGGKQGSGMIAAPSVYMSCSGSIKVDQGMTILARSEFSVSSDDSVFLLGSGHTVAAIVAPRVNVVSAVDVLINATIQGSLSSETLWSLAVDAVGDVTLLPNMGGQWILNSVMVLGNHVMIGVPLMYTQSDACGNKQSEGDICQALFYNGAVNAAFADGARALSTLRSPRDLPSNVTFDFMVAATGSIRLTNSAKIKAASMLLCSAGALMFEAGSILDVAGRGCGPGQGPGTGGSIGLDQQCGSGGGSHCGLGGYGGSFDVRQVTPCSPPGTIYEHPDVKPDAPMKYLPSSGASGGGCTGYDNPDACNRLPRYTSSGGGLLWLSAKGTITVQTHLTLLANGGGGAEVTVNVTTNVTTASGGGCGGQVFVFADSLELTDVDPKQVAISVEAKGGDTGCSRFPNTGTGAVGGAGAGGFIGFSIVQPFKFTENWTEMLYSGGRLSKDCDTSDIPTSGLTTAFGGRGMAVRMSPCAAGRFGMLCLRCPNGTWSQAGSLECHMCENMPKHHAYYPDDVTGNPSWKCPYMCQNSVPAVNTNPNCKSTFEYIFYFYGGRAGAVVLCIVFLVFCIFLFFRRFSRKRRTTPHSFSTQGLEDNSLVARLSKKIWSCLIVAGGAQRVSGGAQSSPFHFPREHLSHHLFRVYLHGQNRSGSKWTLDREMPDDVRLLVLDSRWQELAMDVQRLGKIGRMERMLEGIFRWVYPPLAPIWARRCRQKRARKIQRRIRIVSEGNDVRTEFWKPLRARVHGVGAGLGMTFGCDNGATVGFLDFFDYSRSQMDYHVDLQDWAYILPVHGYGTFDEPFEIDCGDPLVWHLTAAHLGRRAVCCVVSTFNQVSRVVSRGELDQDTPMMQTLQEAVRKCTQWLEELHGSLMVLSIVQTYRKQPVLTESLTGSVGLDGTQSFADLQRPLQPTVPRLRSNTAGSSFGTAAPVGNRSCLGVGLVFTSVPMVTMDRGPGEPLPIFSVASMQGSLVTPVRTQEMRDQINRTSENCAFSHTTAGYQTTFQERLFRLLSCRERPVLPRMLEWLRPDTILLAVTLVGFFDALLFFVFIYMFYDLFTDWTFVYLLVPPFVEPAAIILGVLFVISEYPMMGRTHVEFTFFSLVPITLGTLLCLIGSNASWLFWILQWFLRCGLKILLLVLASMHIHNLMVIWDHNYLESEVCSFATNVLREESSLGRRHCRSTTSSLGPSNAVSFGEPRRQSWLSVEAERSGEGRSQIRDGSGGLEALQVQERGVSPPPPRSPRDPRERPSSSGWGFGRMDSVASEASLPPRPSYSARSATKDRVGPQPSLQSEPSPF